jgi:hypothetical protein
MPVAFLNIGSWDLRHAIITGQREKMNRYLYRCIDFVVNKLRELQEEGQAVSQVNFIVNLAGYSVTQQGCLQCNYITSESIDFMLFWDLKTYVLCMKTHLSLSGIPFYVEFVSVYELRYPGIADKIILVNSKKNR